jgi:hypothetical protein
MRFILLFTALSSFGCVTAPKEPLKYTPCVVLRDDSNECRAVPVNQPEKQDFDRKLKSSDVCLPAADYVELQRRAKK